MKNKITDSRIFSIHFRLFILSFFLFNSSVFSQVLVSPNTSGYSNLYNAFTAINSGYHGSGAITVTIYNNTVETVSATLNSGVFSSCYIQPSGAQTVSGNFNGALIVLDGADNVTIDGRNVSGNSLTLANLNGGNSSACVRLSNGASNNTIKNLTCNAYGVTTTGARTIHVAQSNNSLGNNYNIIEYNTVDGGRRGIQTFGTASSVVNEGTIIRYNKVKNISGYGIFNGPETRNTSIIGNEVFMDQLVQNENTYFAIITQGVGTIEISRNKIHDINSYPAASYYLMFLQPLNLTAPGSSATTLNVSNNMVSLTDPYIYLGYRYAITLQSASTSPAAQANVYYNTVLITGTKKSNIYAPCFNSWYTPAGSVLNLKNNIFINKIQGGTNNFACWLYQHPNTTINHDYNVYVVTDQASGYCVAWNNSFHNNPAYYRQTVCNPDIKDLHSILSSSLRFVSDGDLHLVDSSVVDGINGTPVPGITTDIDGQVRNSINPYRGADELSGEFLEIKLTFAVQGAYPPNSDVVTVGLVEDNYPDYNIIGMTTVVTDGTSDPRGVVVVKHGPGALGRPVFGWWGMTIIVNHAIFVWWPCWQVHPPDPGWLCPENFTDPRTNPMEIDITDSIGSVYGSNQIMYNGLASMYNGDVNEDGSIDLSDIVQIFNDANLFVAGNYLVNDITRDGIVDLTDIIITANNASNFITEIRPGNVPEIPAALKNNKRDLQNNKMQVYNIPEVKPQTE